MQGTLSCSLVLKLKIEKGDHKNLSDFQNLMCVDSKRIATEDFEYFFIDPEKISSNNMLVI